MSFRKLKYRYSFKSQNSYDNNINVVNQNPDDKVLRVSFNQEMMEKLSPNLNLTARAGIIDNTETSETVDRRSSCNDQKSQFERQKIISTGVLANLRKQEFQLRSNHQNEYINVLGSKDGRIDEKMMSKDSINEGTLYCDSPNSGYVPQSSFKFKKGMGMGAFNL